jgi:uncharacterized cupredoxin-like copper-binding protein
MRSSLAAWIVCAALVTPAAAHGPPTPGATDFVETPFGRTGDPRRVTRTIRIDMHDTMRFDPAQVTVRQGETVRFVVRNRGRTMHELVIGTAEDLRRHAELMRNDPQMEHDAPYMAHVSPGGRGEIVWQFTQPGEFRFGCLVAGHFEAGMTGSLRVVARRDEAR